MDSLGKLMLVAGLALAVCGALIWLFAGKLTSGLLPGDLVIERGNFKFYFPIVTCIVVSVVLTLLLRFLNR